MRFLRNPTFDPKRIPGVQAHLQEAANEVADTAEDLGSEIATSYATRVEENGDSYRVIAKTRGIDAAGWIEYGTQKLPAHAPLRRGVESAGLQLRGPE